MHIFSLYVVTGCKACWARVYMCGAFLLDFTIALVIKSTQLQTHAWVWASHVQFAEVPWDNEDEALASPRVPAQPLLSVGGSRDGGWVLG